MPWSNRLTKSAVASLTLKPAQDRLVGSADDEKMPPAPKSTKRAEAAVPTGAEPSFYLSLRPSLWPCTAGDGGVRNASKRSFTTA
jgi:hypothetical protein